MVIAIFATIGALAGLHSACWGAYKDSPIEGFVPAKMFRSMFTGLILGVIAPFIPPFADAIESPGLNAGVYLVGIVAAERLVTEFYKGFLRVESQDKYAVPSMFHVGGYVVRHPATRIAALVLAAIVYVSLFQFSQVVTTIQLGMTHLWGTALFAGVPFLPANSLQGHGWLAGLLAGMIVALGGAYKDAPSEGFRFSAFVRSPLIGLAWGMLLMRYTHDPQVLFLACVGAERMTVELYKGFLVKRRPSKFRLSYSAQSINQETLAVIRRALILPYSLTWLAFIALLFGDIIIHR